MTTRSPRETVSPAPIRKKASANVSTELHANSPATPAMFSAVEMTNVGVSAIRRPSGPMS